MSLEQNLRITETWNIEKLLRLVASLTVATRRRIFHGIILICIVITRNFMEILRLNTLYKVYL